MFLLLFNYSPDLLRNLAGKDSGLKQGVSQSRSPSLRSLGRKRRQARGTRLGVSECSTLGTRLGLTLGTNLVPRACDPWEGNEGSGIIRCRKPGILAKIELRIHFNGQSDSSLKRIIPEPSFPSQGSQARGTRLPGDEVAIIFVFVKWKHRMDYFWAPYFDTRVVCKLCL